MKTSRAVGHASLGAGRRPWMLLVGLVLSAGFYPPASAATGDIVAVYSTTYNRYHRVRLPDRTIKPETFTFARGGYWGGPYPDNSIDGMPFMSIVRTIAAPLRQRGYVAGTDPNKTDLIVFVYWGTTRGSRGMDHSNALSMYQDSLNALSNGPASGAAQFSSQNALRNALQDDADSKETMLRIANEARDALNARNARILGYGDSLQFTLVVPWVGTATGILDDLEYNRFFVILRAYDFQLLWKQKKWKPLWETIYSIPQQGNRFDRELAFMTAQAAPYFGSAKGLIRNSVPDGTVQVGEPTVVPQDEKK